MFARVFAGFAPGTVFLGAILLGLVQALVVTWTATQQPWIGADLRADESGGVVVAGVAPDGPARALPTGAQVLRIGTGAGDGVVLEAADRIEEPDMLGTGAAFARFIARQDDLHRILSTGGPVQIDLRSTTGDVTILIQPAPNRPITDLPFVYWMQLGVGLAGLWLGAWVAALRASDRAAWMLLLAGYGLAISAHGAALYSTREVALDALVFEIASRHNSAGALIYGIGMITLFLLYPKPLVRGLWLGLPAVVLSAFILWLQLDNWPSRATMLQHGISGAMAALVGSLFAQIWVNRRDAHARAMLGWFGLSILVGAGGFVMTVIVPVLLGYSPIIAQSAGFALFLVIYVGLCLGVLRYRLFDLSDWAFRFLFYAGGVVLLLALDALLIFGLSLDRAPALGASLAAVALIYLPLRGWLAERFRRRAPTSVEDMFLRLSQIAQADDPREREKRLRDLLQEQFKPLSITPMAEGTGPARLEADGRELVFPAMMTTPAQRLIWADGGARLFSSRDLAAAEKMHRLLDSAIVQHQTYRDAVEAERRRINRDMHDNIGVLLLGALHSGDVARKDLLIRQTLTDLREIISNPAMDSRDLEPLLADLRAEVAEHLESAGVTLDWAQTDLPQAIVEPRVVHTLRAVLREGVNNLMRHANARRAEVRITGRVPVAQTGGDGPPAALLELHLSDDGKGFDLASPRKGNGFVNLRERIEKCAGHFEVRSSAAGTLLSVRLPLAPEARAR